jgi:hypothetical protein
MLAFPSGLAQLAGWSDLRAGQLKIEARLAPVPGHNPQGLSETGGRAKGAGVTQSWRQLLNNSPMAQEQHRSPEDPALLLTGCMALGKPVPLSGPQGSHLLNKRVTREQ